ncbi:beta strand repeat-containing protein [Rhodoluna limnophila]|uniref:beta strand repeat-containing protein n=1 Tax=Rhodoluna limnophila TaxID=232537 RepID=UPI0011071FCF|nr:hypothetical protein [Rhodoluna limnophila]
MSKNLTRKGLAFGALVALGSTLIAGAPASALGQADNTFVSLIPSAGSEYTVLSGNGKTFDLTANESSTVAGGNVSFLVEDTDSKLEPVAANTTNYGFTVDSFAAGTDEVVTINEAGHTLKNGDVVIITGLTTVLDSTNAEAAAASINNAAPYVISDVVANVSFKVTAKSAVAAAIVAADPAGDDAVLFAKPDTGTIELVRSARATNGSFVVNTGVNSASTNETLRLVQGDETTTRTATVTAWVDSNGDREINGTEYASPSRVVTFKKSTEVTATAAIDAPTVGETSIVSHITTTPALNGSQMSNGDVDGYVTFQGSATDFDPANSASVFNSTTRVWDVTYSRSIGIDAIDWTDSSDSSVASTDSAAAHGFAVGETVIIASGDNELNDGTFVITSKTDDTFTYTDATGADTTSDTGTATISIVAGSYSVTPKIGSDKIGSAASVVVGAVKAATGATTVVEGANVNSADNDGSADVTVRAKTLAVSGKWAFKDADKALVSAGRPVKITVTTLTGVTGVKVNGTSVVSGDVVSATTDANGEVVANVTATAAVDGNKLKLTAVAEGVSGTSEYIEWTWSNGTNYLYDLNHADSLYRAISKGGSYTFDFALVDTWAQNLTTGDYRLKVAVGGNTVSETYPALSNGRASVTVTDAQIGTSNVTVDVTVQKKNSSGTWAAGTVDSIVLPSVVNYVLVPTSGTGAVTATSTDVTGDFTTDAFVTGDTRITQAAVSGDGSTGTTGIEITGSVTDSLTGVTRPGAIVTISGDSSLLFVSGAKASTGSISIAASSTGTYSVHVRSNKAQKDTVVTVASLGGTKTIKITFDVALEDTASNLTITAPAQVVPGRTVTVKVALTDKFGNAVITGTGKRTGSTTPSVKVTYDGPGYVTSTIATTTDENGLISFVVLMGAADSGVGTVTAKYDSNGSVADVTGTTVVLSKTATITVGAAAPAAVAAAASGSTGKFFASVSNAAGKKVVVKVSGKFVTSFTGTAAKKSVAIAALKGNRTVTIYVGGTLVLTKLVTIK